MDLKHLIPHQRRREFGPALDLQFATDKTLTARVGPTPVFTRGSNATVVGSNGLVRYAPNNSSLYSGQLVVGTGWNSDTIAGITSTVDGVGPDGNNAYQITEIANTGVHAIFNTGGTGATGATSVVSGTTYTGSIFIKKVAGSVDWIQLSFAGAGFGIAQYSNFNLSTGAIGNSVGGTAGIEAHANGWYRVSWTAVATATTTTTPNLITLFTNNTNSSVRAVSYAGNTANKVLAAMCQFEIGSTVNTYNPTTTVAFRGPRFDHDPVTLACKGLLIEESRTNTITGSENFTTGWFLNNGATLTSNVYVSPDGANTGDLLTFGTDASSRVEQPVFLQPAGTYTFSVYMRADSPVTMRIGTVSPSQNCAVTTTWTRFSFTVTTAALGTIFPQIGNSAAGGVKSVYVWGAQMEAGSFPTSYIPTTTASVIRSADVCSISGSAFSGFYNQPEGTLVTSSSRTSTNLNAFIGHYSDNSFNNGFDVRHSSATQVAALMNVANSNQVASMQVNITAGSVIKQAFSYKLNDCGYSVNGAATITDASALIPTATRMAIGHTALTSPTLHLNGTISSMRYYRQRLSNSSLQALSAI